MPSPPRASKRKQDLTSSSAYKEALSELLPSGAKKALLDLSDPLSPGSPPVIAAPSPAGVPIATCNSSAGGTEAGSPSVDVADHSTTSGQTNGASLAGPIAMVVAGGSETGVGLASMGSSVSASTIVSGDLSPWMTPSKCSGGDSSSSVTPSKSSFSDTSSPRKDFSGRRMDPERRRKLR
ncbi:unnamed protein product [Protopolystoma xenopodis]|uniref:Uncharacterized protein n=1 Tax=Protopolystoma xenopodis TaxID=117903 RepID=A0A3S5B8V6_9PLAT|nr:unnamed protein product [Protopolystoma xenopodis]